MNGCHATVMLPVCLLCRLLHAAVTDSSWSCVRSECSSPIASSLSMHAQWRTWKQLYSSSRILFIETYSSLQITAFYFHKPTYFTFTTIIRLKTHLVYITKRISINKRLNNRISLYKNMFYIKQTNLIIYKCTL